jgi:hypothetical protein
VTRAWRRTGPVLLWTALLFVAAFWGLLTIPNVGWYSTGPHAWDGECLRGLATFPWVQFAIALPGVLLLIAAGVGGLKSSPWRWRALLVGSVFVAGWVLAVAVSPTDRELFPQSSGYDTSAC